MLLIYSKVVLIYATFWKFPGMKIHGLLIYLHPPHFIHTLKHLSGLPSVPGPFEKQLSELPGLE